MIVVCLHSPDRALRRRHAPVHAHKHTFTCADFLCFNIIRLFVDMSSSRTDLTPTATAPLLDAPPLPSTHSHRCPTLILAATLCSLPSHTSSYHTSLRSLLRHAVAPHLANEETTDPDMRTGEQIRRGVRDQGDAYPEIRTKSLISRTECQLQYWQIIICYS